MQGKGCKWVHSESGRCDIVRIFLYFFLFVQYSVTLFSNVILPKCWPDVRDMIIEANSAGGTAAVRAHSQRQTCCIFMKAYVKQDVLPEKLLLDRVKNDLKRSKKSGRIHGIEFECACLLFIIARVISWGKWI
jgi:hypothetical protein